MTNLELDLMSTSPSYDYARSFVHWTGQSGHRPRCQLDASCRLVGPQGESREFFLSRPCAGERMYAQQDLIHVPVLEFHLVCEPGKEFLMVKVYANDPPEKRFAHRVGDNTRNEDGQVIAISDVDVTLRNFATVRPLTTDEAVVRAIESGLPMLGRTQYAATTDSWGIAAEYPVTVCNARPRDGRWQVDAGPILVPDFSLKAPLTVGLFRRAYIVYNSWDSAEFTLNRPVAPDGAAQVMHFSAPNRLVARNQLFAVVE